MFTFPLMKVLLINGSPRAKGCTFTALSEIAGKLNEHAIETEIFQVRNDMPGCRSCGACKKVGRCVIKDEVNELGERLEEFDGIVIGSPVYYAGPSGQLCSFCDRLFYAHGKKLVDKPGTAIVSCRRGGASAAYDRLNKYFEINNMPVISSQYWNQIHGNFPEEVTQDLEGMQTMRTLGENMAWLLKCIEAGDRENIQRPAREQWVGTNFIR